MFKKILISLSTIFILIFAGCATKRQFIAVNEQPTLGLEGLKRNEYQVLETVTGKGCVTRILGIIKITEPENREMEYNRPSQKAIDLLGWLIGKSSIAHAREIALYSALESVPDADFLLEPRFYDEETGIPLLYTKVCSKVKGKAVRIKPDVTKGP